jgi:hypothetical protein
MQMSFIERSIILAGSPVPFRTRLVRMFLRRFPMGPFSARLKAGAFERPALAFCLYNAARQAKALGHTAITAIEFGVAGGSGLLILCKYRDQIEADLGIRIHLIGLDAGSGLPASTDPRDLLYCWPTGSFEMDVPKLKARIAGRAEIVIGNVSDTAHQLQIPADAPLGAISFDLDYYTSTRDAFSIFNQQNVLPRVWCYFDDVAGTEDHGYSDSIGVRAAIKDFNSARPSTDSHLSQAYAFKYSAPEQWHQQIYIYHRPIHPDYNRCLSAEKHVLELT